MTREHCAGCDAPLGKHRFVSTDGQKLLCNHCIKISRLPGERREDERQKRRQLRPATRRRS